MNQIQKTAERNNKGEVTGNVFVLEIETHNNTKFYTFTFQKGEFADKVYNVKCYTRLPKKIKALFN